MKLLVCIASFGTRNIHFLRRVLNEYRELPFDVRLVVSTEAVKEDLGDDVEQLVGLPTRDPWSLPFAHKKLFAERLDDYDLFLYCEDDTPLSFQNIQAFLQATTYLADGEIVGFMRTETDEAGRRFFPEFHGHFHWNPESVVKRGPYTLAQFSNEHSACYLLTQAQLRAAIRSGGFLTPPRQTEYDLACTASTDPYRRCGFHKLIPISHLEHYLVPHLPNKYIGKMGIAESDLQKQVQVLLQCESPDASAVRLLNATTKISRCRYSHEYFEIPNDDLLSLIPRSAETVLSIGCGCGATEQKLLDQGKQVVALPLDPVIGVLAQDRGVKIVPGDVDSAFRILANDRYDCIIISNLLHLCPTPENVLRQCERILAPHGRIIFDVPNLCSLRSACVQLRGKAAYPLFGDYDSAGCHKVSRRRLTGWLSRAGLRIATIDRKFTFAPNTTASFVGRMPIIRDVAAIQFVVTAVPLAAGDGRSECGTPLGFPRTEIVQEMAGSVSS